MLTTIFCEVDDFCKLIEKELPKRLLTGNPKRDRKGNLRISEIMTICIYFHYSGYKNFKSYYENLVLVHLTNEFHNLVSYSRIVELKSKVSALLFIFAKANTKGKCTGISICDSTSIRACHIKREYSHKTLKKISAKGKTTTGWFYGLKLHIVLSHEGEILDFFLTPGNVSDANKELIDKITKSIFGILVGDKGYIGLFEHLHKKGITLIHKVRKNMKQLPIELWHKFLLSKRSVIETVNGILKESFSLEHSRHRSIVNFFCHIASTLAAYIFKPKKPAINIESFLIS